MKKKNPNALKREGEELQAYLMFKKRGYKVPAKKGKGSYKRNKRKESIEE